MFVLSYVPLYTGNCQCLCSHMSQCTQVIVIVCALILYLILYHQMSLLEQTFYPYIINLNALTVRKPKTLKLQVHVFSTSLRLMVLYSTFYTHNLHKT